MNRFYPSPSYCVIKVLLKKLCREKQVLEHMTFSVQLTTLTSQVASRHSLKTRESLGFSKLVCMTRPKTRITVIKLLLVIFLSVVF